MGLAALAFGYFNAQKKNEGRIKERGLVVAVSEDKKSMLVRGYDSKLYSAAENFTGDWTNLTEGDEVVVYGTDKKKSTATGYLPGNFKVDGPVVEVDLYALEIKRSRKTELQKDNLKSFGDFTYEDNLEVKLEQGRHTLDIWSYSVKYGEGASYIADRFNIEDKESGDLRLNATISDVYLFLADSRGAKKLVPVEFNALKPGDVVYVVPKPPQ
ncbi:hypothetical protein HY638_04655 [Candidatus Woesearchaeota archaeon]|nr:hypothetical protein [Candidatus Woesearchaeota archaeon]